MAVPPFDGYLAIARAGSLLLQNTVTAAVAGRAGGRNGWPAGRLKHDHMRTVHRARAQGSRSVLATIRKPSSRVESGFRRRLDAVLLGAVAGKLRHNALFLERFPSANVFVEALRNTSSALHAHAADVARYNTNQNWGNPVARYTDEDDGEVRVTWLCLDRFGADWHAATGLPAPAADPSASAVDKRPGSTHHSLRHKEALLSAENALFVNTVHFREDYDLYSRACAAGRPRDGGSPRPVVTNGRGKVLGRLANATALWAGL